MGRLATTLLTIAMLLAAAPLAGAAVTDPVAPLTSETSSPGLTLRGDGSPRDFRTVGLYGLSLYSVNYAMLLLTRPPNWHKADNSVIPRWSTFRRNWSRPPVWDPEGLGGGGALGWLQADGDGWATNTVAHALQGSELYLQSRRRGFGAGTALGITALGSTTWEYGFEAWNEHPSAIDLVYTPVAGLLLGEARWQALKLTEGIETTWLRVACAFLLDPLGSVVDVIDGL